MFSMNDRSIDGSIGFPSIRVPIYLHWPGDKKKKRTFVLTIMRSRPCALSTFSRFMTAAKQLVLAIYGSHSQAEKAGKIWENLKETVTQSTR